MDLQPSPLAGVEDVAGRSESQDEAFAAWRGFLEGIADESPLVLVFEDLHWADDGLSTSSTISSTGLRVYRARRRHSPTGAPRRRRLEVARRTLLRSRLPRSRAM